MSKARQTTLFQSWSGSQPSSSVGGASTSDRGQFGNGHFGDGDDEDADLLLALELSLRETGAAGGGDGQVSLAERGGRKMGAPDREPGPITSGLFTSVVGRKDANSNSNFNFNFNSNSNSLTTKTNSATTQAKTCNPASIGLLISKTTSKQGTLTKYTNHQSTHHEEGEHQEQEQDDMSPGEMTEEELARLEDIPGFDKRAGQLWIYPTNYPVRDYQVHMVRVSLFTNTLVVLPTGLGKTFVAAVVMYNFYRWYPQGKVIFMAPTKPLVAQQIEACYNIMGIPQTDAAEMTGAMQPADRKLAWKSRRVFFLTPQVLTNDLTRDALPALSVKCLVIDEAHKALGNHAYCQVVRELAKYEGQFRVLALSATPGSDMKAVQQVITNLMVSHVELRGEDSPDIQPYTHARHVEKVVVPLGAELTAVRDKYIKVMTLVVNRLKRIGVIYNRELTSLSKFLLLKCREAFRQNPPHNLPQNQFGSVEGDFALAISLYHGFDLLQLHGLRSLQSYLLSLISGDKGYGRTRAELLRNADFTHLMEMIKCFTPVKDAMPNTQQTQSKSQLAKPLNIGHPKMSKLLEIALDHFTNFKGSCEGASTRVMIFAQYRDSVNELTEILNRHRPLIQAMAFIGQSSAGKASKGLKQKDQLKVMQRFREGGYNTLVATCVGEEGLDIGDVDLIICFDAHKSPIRLVQRMGRTGRKREGKIIMLVTAGKEEQIYNQSQYTKRSIHKAIQNGTKSLVFYPGSSRMVPFGLNPRCHRMRITVHEKYQPRIKGGKVTSTIRVSSTKGTGPGRKAKVMEDGFLRHEELEYWSKHFKVREEEIHTLPESHFISLKKGAVEPATPEGPTLSLNEWMPWQNRLQTTVLAGHSMQSRHLVDIVQFMQVQIAIGDHDDPYGQEMEMFLKKDDVISKTSRPRGMLRYCTPSEGSSTLSHRKTEEGATSRKVNSNRIRRSEQLPTFSSEEDPASDTSEEDLPAFNGASCQNLSRKTSQVTQNSTATASTSNATARSLETSVEHSVSRKGKGMGKKSPDNHNGKGAGIPVNKMFGSRDSRQDKSAVGNASRKIKHKKKCSAESINQSLVALIEEPPDEDFEDLQEGTTVSPTSYSIKSHTVKDQQESLDGGLVEKREDEKGGQVVEDVVQQASSLNVIIISNSDDEEETAKDKDCLKSTGDLQSVLEMPMSQVLPLATPQKALTTGSMPVDIEGCVSVGGTVELRRVGTPPNVEELPSMLTHLDKRGCLSPVDILELVDKWERQRIAKNSSPKFDCGLVSPREGNLNMKASTVTTPIKIPGLCVKNDIPDLRISDDANISMDKEENIDSTDSAAADLFFNASLVMEKSCNAHVGDKGDCHIDEFKECGKSSGVSKSRQGDENPINLVPDTRSSVENPIESITPFMLRKLSRKGFGNNTSTPVSNKTVCKLGRPPIVEVLNKSDASLVVCDENLRKKADTPQSVLTPQLPTNHSVSSRYDSFFSNLHDDSVLAAIQTPHISLEGFPVAKEPLLIAKEVSSCAKEYSENVIKAPDLLRRPSSPAVHAVMDNTQLTFSQALACIQDSVLNSSSSSSTSGMPHSHLHDMEKSGRNNEQNLNVFEQEDDQSSKKQIHVALTELVLPTKRCASPLPDSDVKHQCPMQLSNRKGSMVPPILMVHPSSVSSSLTHMEQRVAGGANTSLQEPQFDLGFDFDEEFEEDMIIPPSPEAAVGSQGFSLSLHHRSGRTQSSGPMASMLTHERTTVANEADTLRCPSPEDGSPSMLWQGSQKHYANSHRILESANHTKPEWVNEMQVNLTDSLAAVFAEGNSEELFFDEDLLQPVHEDKQETPLPFSSMTKYAENNPRLKSPPSIVSLPKSSFKTPVKPAPKITKSTTKVQLPAVNSDSTDDSPILPLRKQQRRRLVILDEDADDKSPTTSKWKDTIQIVEDDDSPIVPHRKHRLAGMKESANNKRKRAVVFTSEEEEGSPIVPLRAHRRTSGIVDLITVDDNDDDDFVDMTRIKPRAKENAPDGKSTRRKLHHANNQRLVNGAVEFLDLEAERSEDDCSEDESSQEDEYDMSFIHDGTEMSHLQPNPVDMRAVYMQSVRSPIRSSGDFRLACPRDDVMDVFSQMPEQDADYEEDSFVVSGDGEEEAEDVSGEEVALVDLDLDCNITMSRQTRRQAKMAVAQCATTRHQPKAKPGRRVVRMVDSSSEEEERTVERICMQSTGGSVQQRQSLGTLTSSSHTSRRPVVLSSTSEDEVEDVLKRQRNQPLVHAECHLTSSADTSNSSTGITQYASLRTRCIQKMRNVAAHTARVALEKTQLKKSSVKSRWQSDAAPAASQSCIMTKYPNLHIIPLNQEQGASSQGPPKKNVQLTHESARAPAVKRLEPEVGSSTFSLGVDFFDLGHDENSDGNEVNMDGNNKAANLTLHTSTGSSGNRHIPLQRPTTVSEPQRTTSTVCTNSNGNNNNINNNNNKPPLESDRERRLRLSRQRQEEFRRKRADVVSKVVTGGRGDGYRGSQIYPSTQSPLLAARGHVHTVPTPTRTPTPTSSRSLVMTALVTPPKKSPSGRLVILVDSKEINGATGLVSALRFQHGKQVVVRQVVSCDYIVSNRMGVDRMAHSVFSNGTRRTQLELRVRAMCALYDRPCIIIEKDAVKGENQKAPARPQQITKCTAGIMAAIAQTHIKLLFSDSQEQTAQVLSELAVQEQKKGQAISVMTDLTTRQEKMLMFCLSLPSISYVGALNLVHAFSCVADMLHSTHTQLMTRGRMSDVRATDLHTHFNRKFDSQMLGVRS